MTPTATDRIIEGGGKVALAHREFFDVPDALAKPRPHAGRVPIRVTPEVASRLNHVLMDDPRFNGTYGNGMGYSEFITRALDALGCKDYGQNH